MIQTQISANTIKSAYKKLKSYVYEDNTLLHLRIALSEYEDNDLNEKFLNLLKILKEYQNTGKSDDFTKYLARITYTISPKKYSEEESKKGFYSNNLNREKYSIQDKDFNVFIKCPIELHIISIVWIMYIGEQLDKQLDKQVSGYRLSRNSDGNFENDGYKLFQKYHEKYSYFRNSAITKAMDLHQLNLDTTIINLDVKRFFYYIKFDFCDTDLLTSKDFQFLNIMMNSIHKYYQKKLASDNIFKVKTNRILPIGLLSSSIVANYALKDFDTFVQMQIKPENYTRYVDDILLVFSNTNISSMDTLLRYFKCETNKLTFKQKKDYIFFKSNGNQFLFQQEKIRILEFKKDASISLLKKFKQTIEANKSIFNFLPEEKNIFNTLENVSININYSSTINKISSIEKSSLDVLSISRNLSQMIKIVLIIDYNNHEITKYNSHLENIFSGINLLQLSKLWEKLFLYLILSKSFKLLKKFITLILQVIDCIEYSNKEITQKLKFNLLEYLANSLLMSSSLDVRVYKKAIQPFIESKTKDFYGQLYELITTTYIEQNSNNLINSNLVRQYNIRFPLLSYTNDDKNSLDNRLVDKLLILKKPKISIDKHKIEYSPRFLHYHEVLLFRKFTNINNKINLNEIYKEYIEFNKKNADGTKFNYPHISNNIIKIHSNKNFKNLKIGMANINVNPQDSIDSMFGKPNLSYKKLNQIHHILNTALLTHCDLIVFPEISIPIYWIQEIIEFSKRNEIAIIFGAEHFCRNKKIYNYSIVALPFKDGGYKNVYVDFVLKSIYSPKEKQLIEGYDFIVPKDKTKENKRPIYTYKENYFSIFNCYELAEINYRANLVGQVDFIVAIEHNSDTNYFSNIVGSVARDIHAYIVQVNDSRYGDSRITQPAKTEEMDIAKIKGGEDVILLTSTLNVKNLREFQKKSYNLQENDKRFKATPPNFENKVNSERLEF